MTRRRLTTLQRARLFEKHNGVCHICGGKIGVTEAWDVEHVIPLAVGGDDEPANMAPAHKHCHRTKTTGDRRDIAKCERVRAKHMGARKPSRFPGSRTSRFKKKIDGTVEERE